MKINKKIYTLRKKSGWSQDELADKLSVSRQSVSKWETGDSVPEPAKLLALAKIFSVSTDYLLDDSKEEYIPPQAAKSIDTADKVTSKAESLFQNYGWVLGVVLLLLGLWRIVSAVSGIATFTQVGAFGVLSGAAFLPLIFSLLIGIALAVGGIIMIKCLRKKDEAGKTPKRAKRLMILTILAVVLIVSAAIAARFVIDAVYTIDEHSEEVTYVVSSETFEDDSGFGITDNSLTEVS
ncbi:MAG: helix-turn-helix domain-containing protein [Acutalibacteraceae bacterium]